ncbi:MAG: hypothetical protein SFZ02_04955 [bacterium]|nr:hypothetical protein [bacterium]
MPVDWLSEQAHERMIAYLHTHYGDVLLSRMGGTYPVAVKPIHGEKSVEALLGQFDPIYLQSERFALYDDAHLAHLRATRTSLTNGLCYALQSFDEAGKLHGQLGYYFDMLATCDALDQEIRAYARGEIPTLPLREQLHTAVSSEKWLWHGEGRGSTVGLASLVVFLHEGEYQLIFCQRSQNMGVNAGLYHVLPAFVFQPNRVEWVESEWSLTHQFLREFGEELFGIAEYDQWEHANNPHYFYDNPPIADMRAMLADGRAALLPTGAIFNLLSMRSELAMVCIIHDPDWYNRNEAGLNAAMEVERQATFYIPLDTLAGLPENLHLKMTPQGAAVFWLGLEKAREVINA